MKKILYSAIIIAAALATSCSLEEVPLSSIPEADAYQSSKLLYINTVGTVTSGLGTVFKGNTDAFCTIEDISGGQLFCPGRGGGDWQDGGKHQSMFMHTWEEDNDYMRSGWNGGFNKVAAINKAMGTIQKYYDDSINKAELDGYIAELRTLRAIFYWYMLDFYGNVPICDSPEATIAETVQSPREDVYAFVRDELCESIPLLVNAKCQNESDNYYGRVTKAVGYFTLARLALNAPVYLLPTSTFASTNTKEQIAEAVNAKGKEIKITIDGKTMNAWETVIYCQQQVEAMGYKLQPVYADNFSITNGSGNVENIFVIPRDNTAHKVGDQDIQRSLHANHGAYLGIPSNWNGLSGTRQTAFRFGYDFDGDTEYDPRWADTFYFGFPDGEANKTKIKSGYTFDPSKDVDPDGIVDQIPYGYYYVHKVWSEQDTELNKRGYTGNVKMVYLKWGGARYKKYQFDATATSGQNNSNADFAIFRYADLLLMAGEAKYRNGGDGFSEFAAVRNRVGQPTEQGQVDYQFMEEERTRELAFEGIARTDAIRFGSFTRSTVDRNVDMIPYSDSYGVYKDDTDGHTILFAIPSSARQTNPNIKQNPGY